jgi:isoamylase
MVKACTRPASRSSSTWSTTTPPRATTSAPCCRFKGIDNAAYYRLVPDDPRYYMDYTGTGNSLNMRHPHVLQLIMDSLRYWVTEMHVDGFRFDLAATLARELHEVDRLSAFFDLIQQDPVISQVKLIAEPWDVGEGGYQVGNFPPLWSEWNGKYRDTVRDFWRGEDRPLAEFAYRLTGSSDLYETTAAALRQHQLRHRPRRLHPARPGLLQRQAQRGQRRGQPRRRPTTTGRGTAASRARPTTRGPRAARRQQRNFLATLLLSQGVPMLLGGDEIGRTQGGNNNAYCQDNEISWSTGTRSTRTCLKPRSRARRRA